MNCERNDEPQDIIIGSKAEFWLDVFQDGRVFDLSSFTSFTLVFCVPGADPDIEFVLSPPSNPSSGSLFVQLTAALTANLPEGTKDAYLKLDQNPSDPTLVSYKGKFKVSKIC